MKIAELCHVQLVLAEGHTSSEVGLKTGQMSCTLGSR